MTLVTLPDRHVLFNLEELVWAQQIFEGNSIDAGVITAKYSVELRFKTTNSMYLKNYTLDQFRFALEHVKWLKLR